MKTATGNSALPGLRSLAIFLLLILLLPSAKAQAAGEVGLYWDAALTENTTLVDPIPGVVTGYLVLRDPEATAGIVAWELCLDMAQRGQFFDWQLGGQAINLEDPPCFVVGLAEPLLPGGDTVVLATFGFLATEFRPIVFTAGPTPIPSLPGQMSFIRADAAADLQVLGTVTGTPEIAWINPDNPWPEIEPAVVDFGIQPVALETRLSFTVTNAGGGSLELDVGLLAGCAAFALPDLSGPITLAQGESTTITAAFTPPAVGDYACAVGLGGQLPTVALQGSGRESVRSYTVSTTRYFGSVGVGGSKVLSAILSNTGEVPLVVAPELPGCSDVFAIVAGGEPGTVAPGSMRVVNVQFSPTEFDTVRCDLEFGPDIDPVTLIGSGRDPVIGFDVPTTIYFGYVLVGERLTREVVIANTGEIPFTVAPVLTDCGENFEFETGSGVPFTLAPGESGTVRVVCTPQRQAVLACTLGLGPDLPAVALDARGVLVDTNWDITPARVVFPVTLPGALRDTTIVVTYSGLDSLAIDPYLITAGGAFSILSGDGARLLGPNDQAEIVIRFVPTTEIGYATSLSVGDVLPLVALSGTGGQPFSSCAVTPTTLDFGGFLINNSRSREFVITNTGNQPLYVAPGTVSPGYSVSGSPRRLNAGQAATYTVTLTPPGDGVWDGVITTGDALCPEVLCTGTGNYPDVAGNDLVGIFFDPGFSLNEIDLSVYTPHIAYVVLFNPTGASVVSGWECAIELAGRVEASD
ncbi:MAG: choice-of-anchor D domain-containing protein, partial [Candidatus Krumholzibacteria bacterium]|nr:choice-of-anchor D domain-containing protein [Candidatus Krumholzibacteria bacterium]